MRRGFAKQRFIVQIVVHIGENGAFGCELFDPLQRTREMCMGWVRRAAQGVDDPDVEVFEGWPRVIINFRNIR